MTWITVLLHELFYLMYLNVVNYLELSACGQDFVPLPIVIFLCAILKIIIMHREVMYWL